MEIGTSRHIARPTNLNNVLVRHLSPNEFIRIGEYIGMDPDNIYGDKEDMGRGIIIYAQRRGYIAKLFVAIVELNITGLGVNDLEVYYGTLYLPFTYNSINGMRELGERTNITYDTMLVRGMGWNVPSSNKDVIAEQCWEIFIIHKELGTFEGLVNSTFASAHTHDLMTLGWL